MPKNPNPTHYKRNFGLDFLRSLAISIVLLNHAYLGFFVNTGLSKWEGLNAAISASAVFSIEWLFVLSGYLIGSMMIRSFETGNNWWASARDFWLRRWFRTIPNYYLFLILNLMVVWMGFDNGIFSWSFLVFSQNLATPQISPLFFAESWSLALDEWFYFAMPLLLGGIALCKKTEKQNLFWLAALILILIPSISRTIITPPTDFFAWDGDIRRITIFHLDATGWGVAAAILNKWHPQWWNKNKGIKAIIGLLLTGAGVGAMFLFTLKGWGIILNGRLNDIFLITIPCIGTILIMPWLSSIKNVNQISRNISAKIGDYSYSIYLAHYPLIFIFSFYIKKYAEDIGFAVNFIVPLWLITTFAFSAFVFHSFEKPISDMRERFTKRVQAGPFGS